jgi:peptidoglycan/xylan/chitin deacetylase (PgdA/CDA1 family)
MNSDLIVLCYHGISKTWPDQTSVTPEDFAAQIEALLERGYQAQTFASALVVPRSPRTFAITFDDAPLSVYEQAAPILAELGVPATVFVVTENTTFGKPAAWDGISHWLGTEHEKELACMSWDQLGALAEAGWEVGSHTRTHPRLSTLSADVVREELEVSRRECEQRLGAPCLTIAYPYGESNLVAAREAQAAGYMAAATVPTTATSPFPYLWPRIGVYHGESARKVQMRALSRRVGMTPGARHAVSGAGRVVRSVRRR